MVRSISVYMQRLKHVLQEPGFDAELDAAVANPKGPEAKRLLRIMMPLLRTTGRKIPWGPLERANELPKMYAPVAQPTLELPFSRFRPLAHTLPLPRAGSPKGRSGNVCGAAAAAACAARGAAAAAAGAADAAAGCGAAAARLREGNSPKGRSGNFVKLRQLYAPRFAQRLRSVGLY